MFAATWRTGFGLLILTALVVRPAAAQTLLPPSTNILLTLEQAKQLALQSNKSLNLARLNTLEKHHATAATNTLYFPRIVGTISYLRFDDELGTVLTSKAINLGPINIASKTVALPIINQDAPMYGALVLQPITKLVTIHAAVQIARADEGIAHAQLEKGERDVVSGVTQLYLGLWGLQRLEQAITLQVGAGKQFLAAKPNPAVRLQVLEGEKGLLDVRGKIAEMRAQLADLLDLPSCSIIELVEPAPLPLPVRCAEDAVQLALANNPQINEAQQTIVKAHNGVRIACNDLYPDVNFVGGAFKQGTTDLIQNDFGFVGVAATYTFGWGQKHHVKQQRRTQLDMAQQNLQVTIDKVRLEVSKAFREYDQAQQTLQLADATVQAQQELEKAAQDPMTMATAKAGTAQAQLAQFQADLNYRLAHAKLLGALGEP